MFCPNCGANNSTEQKFCRACGLNLEKSVESLLEQIPTAESANLLKYQRNVDRFGTFALAGLSLTVLVGVGAFLWNVIEKYLLSGTNIYKALFVSAFVFFGILSLIFVILNEIAKDKKKDIEVDSKENAIAAERETAKLLEEKPFQPIPSAVENTTELLLVENETRKFR